jgi:hypothetical protein
MKRYFHNGSNSLKNFAGDPNLCRRLVAVQLTRSQAGLAFLTSFPVNAKMIVHAAVAQVVERSPEKAGVGGSTPSRGTIFSISSQTPEPKPATK